MKLPAVTIAAAFASGIAFGLSSVVAGHARSSFFLGVVFAVAAASLLTVVLLLHYKRLALAAIASGNRLDHPRRGGGLHRYAAATR